METLKRAEKGCCFYSSGWLRLKFHHMDFTDGLFKSCKCSFILLMCSISD